MQMKDYVKMCAPQEATEGDRRKQADSEARDERNALKFEGSRGMKCARAWSKFQAERTIDAKSDVRTCWSARGF